MIAPSRRSFLNMVGLAGVYALSHRVLSPSLQLFAAEDPLLSGRPLVRYPEKTDLILLTARPPQLETPMKYFDRTITPNDAFFVRYHVFPVPTRVDLDTWRLKIGGSVESPMELSMEDLKTKFERVTVTAVAQCSGNSRGRFSPRVNGGQWGDGAMGCAEWAGVRLRDVLNKAGVRKEAVEVLFNGLDKPAFPSVPDFVKSLEVSRILDDPNILIAYQMNSESLPMLNGFPARVVVPGWYADHWVKNLTEITVLDKPNDNFWTKTAYRIPDNFCGCVEPGSSPLHTIPINRLKVRSFIAAPANDTRVPRGRPVRLKGIAFDGGYGISEVQISDDGGNRWLRVELGKDHGPFAFREWTADWTPPRVGDYRISVRAFNPIGESQSATPLWNPAGYQRNVIEQIEVHVV
jgi:sulfite dehydrogenase (cytochrome) subunit A